MGWSRLRGGGELMPVAFPSLKPASRRYSPGEYPQTDFVAQNGARTVIRFGSRRVDSELDLRFDNITNTEAAAILANYEAVNRTWENVTFTPQDGSVGAGALAQYIQESGGSGLRWRYSGPPTVTSVKPGISSVSCKFVGTLDPS